MTGHTLISSTHHMLTHGLILFQSIIVSLVRLIFTYPSVYVDSVDMIYALKLGAFKYINCVSRVCNLKKSRSGYVIYSIYTLGISDEQTLEQVVRLATLKFYWTKRIFFRWECFCLCRMIWFNYYVLHLHIDVSPLSTMRWTIRTDKFTFFYFHKSIYTHWGWVNIQF